MVHRKVTTKELDDHLYNLWKPLMSKICENGGNEHGIK